jgi:zinc D-Ala-D-Ala carboxypeptidase
MAQAELDGMLTRAAEEGARRALSDAGLAGRHAVLPGWALSECIPLLRERTALQVITIGLLLALLAGIALKLFAPPPNPFDPYGPSGPPPGGPSFLGEPMTYHPHWHDVPPTAWRWPNFSPAEIACRGTGKLLVNGTALDKLQALRDRLGKPLIVLSAYRSPEHNRAVGGAKASKHMEGIAFDIAMANHDPEAFEEAARAVGFQGFGFYPRSGFMHIDLGPARSWGERFPKRTSAFAAETPPAREVLAESRTLKGGGAAGVATIGAAGVEVAQEALAETQGAILPLVPYLDTLRWVFIAIALAGIAVAIYARIDDWRRRLR